MKIITFYLPQFHQIPENDEWWGEGFTEWTAVKQAEPLFEGHYQPRIPLYGDYYNLLDKRVMESQSALMKKYGVFGQCFYHYYFKDGKQVLQKPAENLLAWTDIDMPFCFSWANDAWVRSWSAVKGNGFDWAPKFAKNRLKDNVLLEQDYGCEADWKKHFYYLLPFFRDKRYIKIEGKPVFLIYHPAFIPCLEEMICYWKKLSQKEGMEGMYIIGANWNEAQMPFLDALYCHAPSSLFGVTQKVFNGGCHTMNYDELWRNILSEMPCGSQKLYYGGFVDFDDSPRRGNDGRALIDVSPVKFEMYLKQLLKKSEVYGNEYVFLNAWNEWGEGMYLEPDERYGTSYLEAVSNALSSYSKTTLFAPQTFLKEKILKRKLDRYKDYWQLFDMWLFLKERNIFPTKYLVDKGVKTVAVYGMGMVAQHLLTELEQQNFCISCIIDRKEGLRYKTVPVVTLEDAIFYDCDAVIVTVEYDYDEIKKMLKNRTNFHIFSLYAIVQSVYNSLSAEKD